IRWSTRQCADGPGLRPNLDVSAADSRLDRSNTLRRADPPLIDRPAGRAIDRRARSIQAARTMIVINVEGNFDRAAAESLRRSLDALDGDADVVLDFSRVAQFRDLAIDVLARGLKAHSITVRGLAGHQERMFRYFGIATPQRPSSDDRDDASA